MASRGKMPQDTRGDQNLSGEGSDHEEAIGKKAGAA